MPICGKSFSAKANLKRHVCNCYGEVHRVHCPYCNKTRTNVDDLIRHRIVNNHLEKVAEVSRDKTLIKTVLSTSQPPDKKGKERGFPRNEQGHSKGNAKGSEKVHQQCYIEGATACANTFPTEVSSLYQ